MIDPYLDDRDALEAAIDIVRKHRERWQELLNLAWERGWQEAAAVAAYDAQCRSMRLPPWEKPPCAASVRGKACSSARFPSFILGRLRPLPRPAPR